MNKSRQMITAAVNRMIASGAELVAEMPTPECVTERESRAAAEAAEVAEPMNVRILVGAHAYAMIEQGVCRCDVLLSPGRSAHQSLRESANEIDAKIARLTRDAARLRQAAAILEARSGR